MNSDTEEDVLPALYWGLDPLFSVAAHLFIGTVLTLPVMPGTSEVYRVYTHPITRVHVQGVVVGVERKYALNVYTLDDGTGLITCVHWLTGPRSASRQSMVAEAGSTDPVGPPPQQPPPPPQLQQRPAAPAAELGDTLSVQGRLTHFRGERQITVKSLHRETDPNAESLWRLTVCDLMRHCYSQPMVIPPVLLGSEAGGRTGRGPSAAASLSTTVGSGPRLTEMDLMDAVLQRVQALVESERLPRVPVTRVLRDERLRAMAAQVLGVPAVAGGTGREVSEAEDRIQRLFQSALGRLVTRGALFTAILTAEPRSSPDGETATPTATAAAVVELELVSLSLNLGPAVQNVVVALQACAERTYLARNVLFCCRLFLCSGEDGREGC